MKGANNFSPATTLAGVNSGAGSYTGGGMLPLANIADPSGKSYNFTRKSGVRNLLSGLFSFLAPAMTAERGGLAKGGLGLMNYLNQQQYMNDLGNLAALEYQNQGTNANAYAQAMRDAGVTGLNNVAPGFDPQDAGVGADLQKGTNTANWQNNSNIAGTLQPMDGVVDAGQVGTYINNMEQYKQKRLESPQEGFNAGVQGIRQIYPIAIDGKPQPLQQQTQFAQQNNDGTVLDGQLQPNQTFTGGVQDNVRPEQSYQAPNTNAPYYTQDAFKLGVDTGYNVDFQAPKLQAETQTELQRPNLIKAQTNNYNTGAVENTSHARLMDRTDPNIRSGGSAIDPMLSLSREAGIIDSSISSVVSRLNSLDDSLQNENIDSSSKEMILQERFTLSNQLNDLQARKQRIMNYPTAPMPITNGAQVLPPSPNVPQNMPVNNAANYKAKWGIR